MGDLIKPRGMARAIREGVTQWETKAGRRIRTRVRSRRQPSKSKR
jgi:hypothetical protein